MVKALWASRAFRYAVGAAVAATVLQLAWLVGAGTLDSSNSNTPGVPGSLSNVANGSLGRGLIYYDELIGVFGWRDTSPPTGVWLLWTAAIAALATIGILLARRPIVMAMLSTALLTWLLPLASSTRDAAQRGVLLAGALHAAARSRRPDPRGRSGRRSQGGSAASHRDACCGASGSRSASRRCSRSDRRSDATRSARTGPTTSSPTPLWSPPIPAALLLVGFAIAVAAWYALLLAEVPGAEPGDESDVPSAPTAATTG